MKIYFDANCGICNKCKNLVLKLEKSPGLAGGCEFFNMHDSIYKNEIKKTILVTENIDGKKLEVRYGKALKIIFKKLIFPFNLFGYLPEFLLTFFYIILRESRNKFSKNICEID